jgi:hypothetical protein
MPFWPDRSGSGPPVLVIPTHIERTLSELKLCEEFFVAERRQQVVTTIRNAESALRYMQEQLEEVMTAARQIAYVTMVARDGQMTFEQLLREVREAVQR